MTMACISGKDGKKITYVQLLHRASMSQVFPVSLFPATQEVATQMQELLTKHGVTRYCATGVLKLDRGLILNVTDFSLSASSQKSGAPDNGFGKDSDDLDDTMSPRRAPEKEDSGVSTGNQ